MNIVNSVNINFPQDKEIKVLEEIENRLLIDKPLGMVVNRAVSHKGYTVQDWMRDRYPNIFSPVKVKLAQEKITFFQNSLEVLLQNNEDDEGVNWDELNYWMFWERDGVVHRLDKDTSGVMVLAKSPEEYVRLLGLFRERKVRKIYRALVHGYISEDQGVIDKPIGRLPWNRTRFGVLADGRESITEFRVIERWQSVVPQLGMDKEDYSLVELYPKTGRTHQIRVHMLASGHPLVGDSIYAGRKTVKKDKFWCDRLCLRAVRLTF